MTIQEMHYDFDLKIDRVASFSKEDFNVAEKDWLLNEGQWVYLKSHYGINNSKRAGFEATQKRIDDLSTLHIKYPVQDSITLTEHDGNIYELDLSDLDYDYLFLTRARVEILEDGCDPKVVSVREVESDDLNSVLIDPFNQASILNGIPANFGLNSSGNGSSIYLYPGDLTLGKIYPEYLRRPPRLSYGSYLYIDGVTYPQQNCILPDHTHPEIVDIAVEIASGIIEHPTYVQLKERKVFKHE